MNLPEAQPAPPTNTTNARNEMSTNTMEPVLPDLKDFETFYGIRVSSFGEEGELVALGHHEPRKVIAAFNRYSREVIKLDGVWDDKFTTYDDVKPNLVSSWAILLGPCGVCGEPSGTPECDRCAAVRNGDWWMNPWVRQGEPGAFPITMLTN